MKKIFLISLLSLVPFIAGASGLDGTWELYDVGCFHPLYGSDCKSDMKTKTFTISQEPLKMCTETTFANGQEKQSGCLVAYEKEGKVEKEKLELRLSEDGNSFSSVYTYTRGREKRVRSLYYAVNREKKNYMRIYETIKYYSYWPEFKSWRETFEPWHKEYYFRR